MNPRNYCTYLIRVVLVHVVTLDTLLSSTLTLPILTICIIYSTCITLNMHFYYFEKIFSWYNLVNTVRRWAMCSSIIELYIKIWSKYTNMKWSNSPWNTLSIKFKIVLEVLHKHISSTIHSNRLYISKKSVFYIWPGATPI